MTKSQKSRLRVALVVPHIFFHQDILPDVIFSPGDLAIELANGLGDYDIDVTLFSPGPIKCNVNNITADLSYFERELAGRGDTFIDLLRKHPAIFVSLARQVQSEIIAKAYAAANNDDFDIVHIYTNEEDIALPFSKLCSKPVVFTHHDPFSFLIKYKNVFPKYTDLNWVSMSYAQRSEMPTNTNWVANIYHGLGKNLFKPTLKPKSNYVVYIGRIIKSKGVDLAISAVKQYNKTADSPMKLKIAGKHYANESNDSYWQEFIQPQLDENIEYVGFIKDNNEKNEFLANAKALIIPSTFNEPFGMVMIEALACGTPIVGLNSGAIPEIINDKNGILVTKSTDRQIIVDRLCSAINNIDSINRKTCRQDFERRFTLDQMIGQHSDLYKKLARQSLSEL